MDAVAIENFITYITIAAYAGMFLFTRFTDTPQDDGWKGKLYRIMETITLISPKSKQVNVMLENLKATKAGDLLTVSKEELDKIKVKRRL